MKHREKATIEDLIGMLNDKPGCVLIGAHIGAAEWVGFVHGELIVATPLCHELSRAVENQSRQAALAEVTQALFGSPYVTFCWPSTRRLEIKEARKRQWLRNSLSTVTKKLHDAIDSGAGDDAPGRWLAEKTRLARLIQESYKANR